MSKNIHFGQDNELEIVDLINELATALRDGHKVVSIETEEGNDGNNQDGSSEFEFTISHLECKEF